MNNSYQAKNGFKTFVFVFVLSLGVFSLFYYLTSQPTQEVNIENHEEVKQAVLGETESTEQGESAFQKLAEEEVDVPSPYVLAGATETTGSTGAVPDTGVTGLTTGLLISSGLFLMGIYLLVINPRNTALKKFEKSFLED